MAEGLTPDLAAAGILVAVLSALVLRRFVSPLTLLVVVAVKVALPVAYFAWFYDGIWTFLDDVTYWNHGRMMLAAGYEPFTVLFRPDGVAYLVMLSLGPHILYAWWNQLAQYFLGPHYFAPVMFNVILTCVSGVILYRIARVGGFSKSYASGLLVFFVLHWELLVWSSFVNLKDVLVFTMALAALYCFLVVVNTDAARKRRLAAATGLTLVLLALPGLRFYVPVLILGSCGIWATLNLQGRKRTVIMVAGVLVALLVLPGLVPVQYLEFGPAAVIAGFVKGPLTPRPWAIYPEYSFLTVPAILHWITFVPALFGGYLLWRRSRAASLILVYLLVTSLLSALAPEFQGPRHRVHVVFAWAWMQYHALVAVFESIALPGAVEQDAATDPLLFRTGRIAA